MRTPRLAVSLPLGCFCLILAGVAGFFLGTCLSATPEVVVEGVGSVRSIAIDSSRELLYLVDAPGSSIDDTNRSVPSRIRRSTLAGTDVMEISIPGMQRPHSVALDTTLGKMYWTDIVAGKVQRALYNGSSVEDVAVGLDWPSSIAVVPAGGDASDAKVFWADLGRIQQASVPDGPLDVLPEVSNLVDLTDDDGSSFTLPIFTGLAVKGFVQERVYWTRSGMIQSVSAEGEVRDEISGLSSPRSIVIGSYGDTMWWTEDGGIFMANVDGPDAEELFTSPFAPSSLALDKEASMLYWADESGDVLWRSDLSGECLIYRVAASAFASALPSYVYLVAHVFLAAVLGCSLPCCCCFAACAIRRRRQSAAGNTGQPVRQSAVDDAFADARAGRPKELTRTPTTQMKAAVQTAVRDATAEAEQNMNRSRELVAATTVGAAVKGASILDPTEGPEVEFVRDRNAKCCFFCSSS